MKAQASNDFLQLIDKISDQLNPDEQLINPEYILKFQNRYDLVKENLESILNTDRTLRIGIVGEVKVGKSSFLNGLVFKGKDILPQAATPMTAALTKLVYSPQQSARVVFYTDYDWKQVEFLSGKYDEEYLRIYQERHLIQGSADFYGYIDEEAERFSIEEGIASEYKVCKELTTMVQERSLPIGELLNTEAAISISNVEKDLEQYVGASGRFTPIVKYIELGLNNALLKDMEIIDTPGLNDPILSRSVTTKKFLMKCDLVFLLSYSGQFLNSEDISFITNTLPSEGIQNIYLIGSKFDSALLDFPAKRGQTVAFASALRATQNTLNAQAQTNIQKCLELSSFGNSQVLTKLNDSLPPFYISALIYSAARKLSAKLPLSEYENHILNSLRKRFSNFDPTPELLFEFSNLERVKAKTFSTILADKQKILEDKSKRTIMTERSNFLTLLEDINIQATRNLTDLHCYDKGKLEEKLNILNAKLNSMRQQIKTIFEITAVESQKYINDISADVRCVVKNYTDVQTGKEHKTNHGSYQEGWWIFKSTKHYTETVTVHTASVHDVMANIREYINKAQQIINSDLGKAINISGVQKKVKDSVLQAFDLSNTSFDENDILAPLELVLQKLVLPKIAIDAEIYNEMLLRTFSSAYVQGDQIHELMLKQEEVLQKVTKDICAKLQRTGEEIESILKEQAATFVDSVNDHLSANIRALQDHLQDKETSIANYQRFIEDIKNHKQLLKAYGGRQ